MCLYLEAFDDINGLHFDKGPEPFRIDNLILFIQKCSWDIEGISAAGYLPAINIQFYWMKALELRWCGVEM